MEVWDGRRATRRLQLVPGARQVVLAVSAVGEVVHVAGTDGFHGVVAFHAAGSNSRRPPCSGGRTS